LRRRAQSPHGDAQTLLRDEARIAANIKKLLELLRSTEK
jgi:hypothetical protein